MVLTPLHDLTFTTSSYWKIIAHKRQKIIANNGKNTVLITSLRKFTSNIPLPDRRERFCRSRAFELLLEWFVSIALTISAILEQLYGLSKIKRISVRRCLYYNLLLLYTAKMIYWEMFTKLFPGSLVQHYATLASLRVAPSPGNQFGHAGLNASRRRALHSVANKILLFSKSTHAGS